jgi:hypothetical protein
METPLHRIRKNGEEKISRDERKHTPPELSFVCPICGGDQIIERMKDKRRIRVFEDGKVEFSAPDGWDRDNCAYFCGDCGSHIQSEEFVYFKDRRTLGKWLSQQPEWQLSEELDLHEEIFSDMAAREGEALRVAELRFVCPHCSAHEIDECWVTETPIKFYEDGSVELGWPDYDKNAFRYRCRRCQCLLEDEWGMTVDDDTLMDYLRPSNIS